MEAACEPITHRPTSPRSSTSRTIYREPHRARTRCACAASSLLGTMTSSQVLSPDKNLHPIALAKRGAECRGVLAEHDASAPDLVLDQRTGVRCVAWRVGRRGHFQALLHHLAGLLGARRLMAGR